MNDLMYVLIVLIVAMVPILISVFISDRKDKEEFEHYMDEHPEKRFKHAHHPGI